jgi:hypothetical protein
VRAESLPISRQAFTGQTDAAIADVGLALTKVMNAQDPEEHRRKTLAGIY